MLECRQGADVSIQINLSFMDAAKGCTKEVEVPMKVECTTCSGTGCTPGSSSRTCTYCSGKGETIASQMGGMFQVCLSPFASVPLPLSFPGTRCEGVAGVFVWLLSCSALSF